MERGAPGAYVAVQTIFQTVLDLRLGQWLGPEVSHGIGPSEFDGNEVIILLGPRMRCVVIPPIHSTS